MRGDGCFNLTLRLQLTQSLTVKSMSYYSFSWLSYELTFVSFALLPQQELAKELVIGVTLRAASGANFSLERERELLCSSSLFKLFFDLR